jgi:choline dehydrogenase-like flavoprotein
MFLDFEAGGDVPQGFHVCIVGAGIVGLTAAWRLRRSGIRILVVEGGGLTDEQRSQAIYSDVEFVNRLNVGVANRFRTYGGNGSRWGGQLLPLADWEFLPRGALRKNAWPLQGQMLAPYFAEAQAMLGVQDAPFDASCYDLRNRRRPHFDQDLLSVRFSKWSPWRKRNVGRLMKSALEKDPDAVVLIHANAVEIVLDESGQLVSGIRLRSYSGREQIAIAGSYILAAGTIEVCRLLLCSRGQLPRGIGNHHDMVGRGFMDHLILRAGHIVPTDRDALAHTIRPFFVGGVLHAPRFEIAPAAQAAADCLNGYAQIHFEARAGSAMAELPTVFRQYHAEGVRALLKGRYWSIMSELPDVVAGFLARTVLGLRPLPARSTPTIYLCCEQPPRRASRICLRDEHDPLGMPKVAIDWHIGFEENKTLSTLGRLIEEQFRKHNLGNVQWHDFNPSANTCSPSIQDFYHHLGGTPMSDSARDGVVDRECRVHGVRNLFIASGATFPVSGCSNPTLTIMALALRMAEHLSRDGVPGRM